MPRRRTYNRSDGVRTSAPREGTLIVAVILWLLGFMDVILNVIALPYNLGIWFLVLSGLLLIIASMVEGI